MQSAITVADVAQFLENWAHLSLQESYDNCGLLVGHNTTKVTGVLTTLDVTEDVLQEAKDNHCNLIVAHHPLIFSGLKSFTGKNSVERIIMDAIRSDIAIYAIHTNLDNVDTGVNAEICNRLGLTNTQILAPKQNLYSKFQVYVPQNSKSAVRQAIFEAGGGQIGDYDHCAYEISGKGSFRGNENTNPTIGAKGEETFVEEVKIETVVPNHMISTVIKATIKAHPYETVAYDCWPLQKVNGPIGAGMIGLLPKATSLQSFLVDVKTIFNVGCLKYTGDLNQPIQKIAVCGGSGSFLLPQVKAAGADVFITADYKYHQFFDAEDDIVIADIGHYESEQFTKQLIARHLQEKFTTFAVHFSKVNTNPVNYL